MAKARKLAISRSERFLGTIYNYSTQNHETAEPELGEEDVWPIVDEIVNDDDDESTDESTGSASMRIRGRNSGQEGGGHMAVGGLSLAFGDDDSGGGKITAASRILHQYHFHDSPRGRQMATSAPVNVPNWGRISRVESVESLPDSDDGVDDNDNQKMVPPHVYLAREYGCSRNSVFEGVGRTLKGRDLSRVRDAVWSRTGFDG